MKVHVFAKMAQLAARHTRNVQVRGSIPRLGLVLINGEIIAILLKCGYSRKLQKQIFLQNFITYYISFINYIRIIYISNK